MVCDVFSWEPPKTDNIHYTIFRVNAKELCTITYIQTQMSRILGRDTAHSSGLFILKNHQAVHSLLVCDSEHDHLPLLHCEQM